VVGCFERCNEAPGGVLRNCTTAIPEAHDRIRGFEKLRTFFSFYKTDFPKQGLTLFVNEKTLIEQLLRF
jgi:hypothetical protein